MEPQWNPMLEEQSLNRVHRIGQTRDVIVNRYIVSNSIEEPCLMTVQYVQSVQQAKLNMVNQSLDGDQISANMWKSRFKDNRNLEMSRTTEARQQMVFRQLSGLAPMPVWFENGWSQSWAWTMLAPYISYCPESITRLAWQNFPTLHIINNPNINRLATNETEQDGSEAVGDRIGDPSISNITDSEPCISAEGIGKSCGAAIAINRTEPLSYSGKRVYFEWDAPSQAVEPNNSYVTATTAGQPKFVGWSSQLKFTYSPLTTTGQNQGYTEQPEGFVFGDDGIINGTMAVMLTDLDLFVTPFNTTMVNPHIVALGLYQAG
ncbi:unnamed protein product [Penicillium palitans]